MAKAALTDREIRALKADGTRRDFADAACIGLKLRVSAQGAKTWSLVLKVGGAYVRSTLGTYPEMSLAAAREAADKQRTALRSGAQPLPQKDRPKTFRALADRYLEEYAAGQMRPRTLEVERSLLRFPLATTGKRNAFNGTDPAKLRRSTIREFLEPIAAQAPTTGNRTQSAVRRVLGWAVEADLLPFNVLAGVKRLRNESPRERHLSDAEIRTVFAKLDADGSPVPQPVAIAIKLLLLTGQRVGQIIGLQRGDIHDLDGGSPLMEWPRERMKGDRSHACPLGPEGVRLVKLALAAADVQLAGSTRRKGRTEGAVSNSAVFPSGRLGQSLKPQQVASATRDFCQKFGIAPFTPHDLRRTATTLMGAAGVSIEAQERVTAHRLPGLSRIYNRHDYLAEKREAILALEARVMAAVGEKTSKRAK